MLVPAELALFPETTEVRAPRPGIVRGIRVSAGASVEGDQELCAIETGPS